MLSLFSPLWKLLLAHLGVKGMCCLEFISLAPLGERGDRKAVGEGGL